MNLPGPLLAAALLFLTLSSPLAARVVDRVSTPTDPLAFGVQGNADSWLGGMPTLSADGRWLVFETMASNLAAGDLNPYSDILIKDLQTGVVSALLPPLASVLDVGYNWAPVVSSDGRFVAFVSERTDLVPGNDDNETDDVFLLDRTLGTIRRLSNNPDGAAGDGYSDGPSISADGRFVVFASDASDLVPGDEADHEDVFLFDRVTDSLTRLSVLPGGGEAPAGSGEPQISADGRYVCFTSRARLLPADNNDHSDVYLLDRSTGQLRLASRTPGGAAGNGESVRCAVATGGQVGFHSWASDLVAGDSNGMPDVFVFEPGSGTVERASVTSGGAQLGSPSWMGSISPDGQRISFSSSAAELPGPHRPFQPEIYLRDRQTQQTRRISIAIDPTEAPNAPSNDSFISSDGSRVLFTSRASNLVAGDTNRAVDVFVHRLADGAIERLSEAAAPVPTGGGGSNGDVSADGEWVVFQSSSPTLTAGFHTQVLLYRRSIRQLTLVSRGLDGLPANGSSLSPRISADGRYVVFSSDADNLVPGASSPGLDVFLFDRYDGNIRRVSSSTDGGPGDRVSVRPVLSADGSRVAFVSTSGNLLPGETSNVLRLLVWTRGDGQLQRVDVRADGVVANDIPVGTPALSANGRYVAFATRATNLSALDGNGASDIYRKDLQTGAVVLVSRTENGNAGNGGSELPAINATGSRVAFLSHASNLVSGDSNGHPDVFVALVGSSTMERRVTALATDPPPSTGAVSLSADARFLVFDTTAPRVASDTNALGDIYVIDRMRNLRRRVSVDRHGREMLGESYSPRIAGGGEWVAFDLWPPGALVVPGRPPAADDSDVVLARNPLGSLVFREGFEP
ncbi:MAG TPA: hypothetical protein PKZ76_05750 [Xanthomonadaceae bacterium]|nr:hypothetical protein [Xanthomonadaceae bacterium]